MFEFKQIGVQETFVFAPVQAIPRQQVQNLAFLFRQIDHHDGFTIIVVIDKRHDGSLTCNG
jgi:hypothetical protein